MATPYVKDILSQSDGLKELLENFEPDALDSVREKLLAGEWDRIILTGMGASYYGAYPAWLKLCKLPIPVVLWDTAELIHYALDQISSRSLVWVISQSGESIEVCRLLDRLRSQRPGLLLGITNQPTSTLGQASEIILPLHAGVELTVSTRTYINTLTLTLLTVAALLGEAVPLWIEKFWRAQAEMAKFLQEWPQHLTTMRDQARKFSRLFLLGRGPSLASAQAGALFIKEAAKFPAEGMETAQFRHGPMEVVDATTSVWIFGGARATLDLNRALGLELKRYGGKVTWVSTSPADELDWIPLPSVDEIALPLLEILPVQALTVAIAELNGLEPGGFRYISKVTTRE